MHCRKCYTRLDPSDSFPRCPRCGVGFDPTDKDTYLARPFPGKWRILWHIVATTIVCFVIAFIVANFQLVQASGH